MLDVFSLVKFKQQSDRIAWISNCPRYYCLYVLDIKFLKKNTISKRYQI